MATAAEAPKAVLLRGDDNVAVAARPIPQGTASFWEVAPSRFASPSAWGTRSRFATSPREIRCGSTARSLALPPGQSPPVPTSTCTTSRPTSSTASMPSPPSAPSCRRWTDRRTFQGFLRPDGRVGTRNYIAVISTVNCSASTSRYIADRFRDGRWRAEFPNVDGIFAITHKGGCGLPFEGPDHEILERVLAGFARHPNVAAYVIVGLGCEGAYAQHLVEAQHLTLAGLPATELAETAQPRLMPPACSTSRTRGESRRRSRPPCEPSVISCPRPTPGGEPSSRPPSFAWRWNAAARMATRVSRPTLRSEWRRTW